MSEFRIKAIPMCKKSTFTILQRGKDFALRFGRDRVSRFGTAPRCGASLLLPLTFHCAVGLRLLDLKDGQYVPCILVRSLWERRNPIFFGVSLPAEADRARVRPGENKAVKRYPTEYEKLVMSNPLSFRFLKRFAVLAGAPLALFAHCAIAAVTTPKYIQGNYATPQTPETAVTVPYTAAQTAGHLNVVVVGWNDTAVPVRSLTDSKGNVYRLAAGPLVTGSFSQSIYYAKNISAASAATNAVTVTFTAAASYPDIRILEYGGIDPANPLDTVAGAIGDGATSSSGAVTTSNATDLLLGANTVQTLTAGAGTGFTLRLLTSPDGDITEDRVVTVAGSYSASAPLTDAGKWVSQIVAFRAASSDTPTSSSTLASTPTPVAVAYVQGNYTAPQTPQKTITVPYTAAQKAGDLNVVIVGWNDSNTYPIALGDSKNNTYQLAVGTALPGKPGLSQVVVYANHISAASAGTNAVTVTFNAAAPYPDVRILEYSGISSSNSLDAAVA